MSDALHSRSKSDPIEQALARTPARLLVGRAGPAYRTETWLKLRADHAIARDAVHDELDLLADFSANRSSGDLIELRTRAKTKTEYLMRPDLGRRLDDESRERLQTQCPRNADLQIAIGDGLSSQAVAKHALPLLDGLCEAANARKWQFGRPLFVRHCRVGVMNDIGDLLDPTIVVLLIGERPGLATADSLSAYLAFRPRAGHTDAQRNLISNIHSRGVSIEEATRRIAAMVELMLSMGKSGVEVKEQPLPLGIRI